MEQDSYEFSLVRERYYFYTRCQSRTESFYDFLNDVFRLAKTCKFNGLEESLIRDRIIFGVHDMELRNKFLKDGGDPTLKEVVETCRSSTEIDDDSEYENPVIEKLEIERDYIGDTGLRFVSDGWIDNGVDTINNYCTTTSKMNYENADAEDDDADSDGGSSSEMDSDDEEEDDDDDDSDEDSECSSSNMSDIVTNEQPITEDPDELMVDAAQCRESEITTNSLNNNSTPVLIEVNNRNPNEIDVKMDESMSSIEGLTEIMNSTVSCDLKSLENLATNFTQITNLDDVTKHLITSSTSTSTSPSIYSSIKSIPIKSEKSNYNDEKALFVNTQMVNGLRHAVNMALSNHTSDDNANDEGIGNMRHICHSDAADDADIDGDDESNGEDETDMNKSFADGLIDSPALSCNTKETFPATDNAQDNRFCDNQLIADQVSDNVLNSTPIERYPLRNKSNGNLDDNINPSNSNTETNIVKHLDAMETVSNLRSILDDLAKISTVKENQNTDNAIESHASRQTRQKTRQISQTTQNAQPIEIISNKDTDELPELRPAFVQLERINLAELCGRFGIIINNANIIEWPNATEIMDNIVPFEDESRQTANGEVNICDKPNTEYCAQNEIVTLDHSTAIASDVELKSKQEAKMVQSLVDTPPPNIMLPAPIEGETNLSESILHSEYQQPSVKVEPTAKNTLLKDDEKEDEARETIKSEKTIATTNSIQDQPSNVKLMPDHFAERSQTDQQLNIVNSVANDNRNSLIMNCNGIIDTSQFVDVEEEIASNVIQVREAVIKDDELVESVRCVDQIPSHIDTQLTKSIVDIKQFIAPPKMPPKLKAKPARNNSITIDLYCYICDTQFWRTNHFRKHLNSHSVRELMNCNKCDIKFSRFIELNCHMIEVHTTIDTICVLCNLNFRNPLHLGQHVKAVHMEKNRKTHKCNICSAAYTCRSDIANHMVSHFTRAFICCTCNESFPSQQLVKEHLKLHSSEQLVQPDVDRTYECYLCKKQTNSYRALTEHMRSHMTENYQTMPTQNTLTAFTCELCLRRFRKIATLQSHMALHMKSENGSTFIQSAQSATSLSVERSTRQARSLFDDAKRKYECGQCNEAFVTDAERRRHSLSHTNEITYECDICQNSYRRKENLHKHQQTKHGYEFIPPIEHNYDAV